jgi:hypothetical protein
MRIGLLLKYQGIRQGSGFRVQDFGFGVQGGALLSATVFNPEPRTPNPFVPFFKNGSAEKSNIRILDPYRLDI